MSANELANAYNSIDKTAFILSGCLFVAVVVTDIRAGLLDIEALVTPLHGRGFQWVKYNDLYTPAPGQCVDALALQSFAASQI